MKKIFYELTVKNTQFVCPEDSLICLAVSKALDLKDYSFCSQKQISIESAIAYLESLGISCKKQA